MSGGYDRTVRTWELQGDRRSAQLERGAWSAQAVAALPDGGSIISGGDDGMVRVWDTESGRELSTIGPHPDRRRMDSTIGTHVHVVDGGVIHTVAVTPDGQHVVSGGDDGAVRLWDVGNAREVYIYEGHAQAVRAAVVAPNGRWAASGGDDGIVCVWDLEGRRKQHVLIHDDGPVTALAVTSDGSRIVSGGTYGVVRIWEVARRPRTA